MKQILILLTIIIFSSIGPASAYSYIHTLTNLNGEQNHFSAGIKLTDTVTPSKGIFDGYKMRFKWEYDGHTKQIAFSPLGQDKKKYIDTFTPTKAGKYKIEAQEYIKVKSHNDKKIESKKSFSVIQAPEFNTLGLLAPLFLIGLFYIGLRKRML
jgi:hypothetical protein